MKNIDLFNEYTARILASLFESFPVKRSVDARTLCGDDEVDDFGIVLDARGQPSKAFDIAMATLIWLSDNGYLRLGTQSQYGFAGVVLTERGLSLLRSSPAVLKAKETFGHKLCRLLREGSIEMAKETANAVLDAGLTAVVL